MIIPDVDHRNLGIGHAEQALGKPHSISIKVETLQFFLHLGSEGSMVLLGGNFELRPLAKVVCFDHHSIVIDLVPTSDHHMERSSLMRIQHIAP